MWLGRTPVEIKLTGDDTEGAFALFEDEPPVGWALPAHRHMNEAETIYIVDGEFEMTIGDEQSTLGPGDVAHVPAGVLHAGRLLSSEPARRVLVFSPSGIEHFFVEAGTDEAQDLDVEQFMAGASATKEPLDLRSQEARVPAAEVHNAAVGGQLAHLEAGSDQGLEHLVAGV